MMRTLLFLLLALPAFAGRDFVAASSQLAIGTIASSSPPLTLFVWANVANDTAAHSLIAVGDSANAFEQVRLLVEGNSGGDPYTIGAVTSAGVVTSTTNGTYTPNTWFSLCGVFASATSRVLYVNGTSIVTNTTSATTTGLNFVVLGARKYTSWGVYASATIAEAAVWTAALTAEEALSLSVGSSPLLIRPERLIYYAPLTGRETSSEWNLVGSAVSLTNAPAASANHPRIYKP